MLVLKYFMETPVEHDLATTLMTAGSPHEQLELLLEHAIADRRLAEASGASEKTLEFLLTYRERFPKFFVMQFEMEMFRLLKTAQIPQVNKDEILSTYMSWTHSES